MVLNADTRHMFYHDVPQTKGKELVLKLKKLFFDALTEGGEYAYSASKDVPVWDVASTQDHMLPVDA